MFVEGLEGVGTGGIAKADFFGECGYGSIQASIVMQDGVENIEGILGLLTVTEGPEFEREKGTDFAYTGSEFLLGTVQVDAFN